MSNKNTNAETHDESTSVAYIIVPDNKSPVEKKTCVCAEALCL